MKIYAMPGDVDSASALDGDNEEFEGCPAKNAPGGAAE